MARKFQINDEVTVVEGGNLNGVDWVCRIKRDGDVIFFDMNGDRTFARAMRLECNARVPFRDTTLVPYLANARNIAVDDLILSAKHKLDPMGDSEIRKGAGISKIKNRETYPYL